MLLMCLIDCIHERSNRLFPSDIKFNLKPNIKRTVHVAQLQIKGSEYSGMCACVWTFHIGCPKKHTILTMHAHLLKLDVCGICDWSIWNFVLHLWTTNLKSMVQHCNFCHPILAQKMQFLWMWSSCGHHMVIMWSSCGHHVVIMSSSHGYHVVIMWSSHGHHVNSKKYV